MKTLYKPRGGVLGSGSWRWSAGADPADGAGEADET